MGLTQTQDAWLPHLRAPRLPLMPQHRGLYIHTHGCLATTFKGTQTTPNATRHRGLYIHGTHTTPGCQAATFKGTQTTPNAAAQGALHPYPWMPGYHN